MTEMISLHDLEISDKKVLIRQDLNVPIKDGHIESEARIKACLPTIEYAVSKKAKVILMSHLGRPREGVPIESQRQFSLSPIAKRLAEMTSLKVRLEPNYLNGCEFINEDILLLENVRVNSGEKANDQKLSRKLAALCDIFVMDAFATSHRAHASTQGVAKYSPVVCAGPLLLKELRALDKVFSSPQRPVLAIVGGSKVSTKLQILTCLSRKVDLIIVGGGIANTFLAAAGKNIGKSLYEPGMIDVAKEIMDCGRIVLPTDAVVSSEIDEAAAWSVKKVDEVSSSDHILDIGPISISKNRNLILDAETIIWNGPLGVFEIPQFSAGTRALGKSIKESKAFSVAGGGDTISAIESSGGRDGISYISTGGGAFLEFLEGKTLPGVTALMVDNAY
ncbi:MAG: phosphoglycerate kinase [Pseudomonadota bacterium]|nr:phosphoglycerate kinase [Pseudomonadota bacterium]